MNIIKHILAAAIIAAPVLAMTAPSADAATASEYSAKGHGRTPIIRKNPSRAIYHRHYHMHRRHHMYHHHMHRM